jgi:hypothetical protein
VDKNGEHMDGSKTYRLNIPADVPARDFWSIVAYDPQTRSQLQTGQPVPGENNQRHQLDVNKDGSIDLYFSPEPHKGKEANWMLTVPRKGWFIALRLYEPLEPWFDNAHHVRVTPLAISYMLSQIALRRELAAIFSELSRIGGPQIALQPMQAADCPEPINFDTLATIAEQHSEIALGVLTTAGEVHLNPYRGENLTIRDSDQLITLTTLREPM